MIVGAFLLLFSIMAYAEPCNKLANNFNVREVARIRGGGGVVFSDLNQFNYSLHGQNRPYKSALLVGGGSFGTAIASVLSHNFTTVFVKIRNPVDYAQLLEGLHKKLVQPGTGEAIEMNIIPVLTWQDLDDYTANSAIDLMVYGLPTSTIKTYTEENKAIFEKYFKQGVPLVSLSKGIDIETKLLPDELFTQAFAQYTEQLYYLSGPSFARELLEGRSTSVSIASTNRSGLGNVVEMFNTAFLRVNRESDVKGLLLGGALKNPLAVAAGMLNELLPGDIEIQAKLVAIGIEELKKFYTAYRADPATLENLSGLGDLIATTMSPQSRNRDFGGTVIKEWQKGSDGLAPAKITVKGGVVEGFKTTKSSYLLLQELNIQSAYVTLLYKILYEGESPQRLVTFVRNYVSPIGKTAVDGDAKNLAKRLRQVLSYGAGIIDALNKGKLNTQALYINYSLKEINRVGSTKFPTTVIFKSTHGIVGYIKTALDPNNPYMQEGIKVGSSRNVGQFSPAAKAEIKAVKELIEALGGEAPLIKALYGIAFLGDQPISLEKVVLELAAQK